MVVSTVLERNPEVIISGSLDLDEVSSAQSDLHRPLHRDTRRTAH